MNRSRIGPFFATAATLALLTACSSGTTASSTVTQPTTAPTTVAAPTTATTATPVTTAVTAAKGCLAKAAAAAVPFTSVIDHDVAAADLVAVRRALGIDKCALNTALAGSDTAVRWPRSMPPP